MVIAPSGDPPPPSPTSAHSYNKYTDTESHTAWPPSCNNVHVQLTYTLMLFNVELFNAARQVLPSFADRALQHGISLITCLRISI